MKSALMSSLYLANDGQGDELGPTATLGGQFFILMTPLVAFGAFPFPGVSALALMAGAFGVALLSPKSVLARIPISISMISLISLVLASIMWTNDLRVTSFDLQRVTPLAVGTIIIAGILPLNKIVEALTWSVRVALAVTFIALITVPAARVHIDPTGQVPSYPGWHGFYTHKNIMAPYLVFGLATIMSFDKPGLLKWTTIGSIATLLIGSTSATAISATILMVSVWVWIHLYRSLDGRNSTLFAASSFSIGIFALAGVAASLSSITAAYGKDLTFSSRTFIWSAALDAIGDRPWFGYGVGGMFGSEPPTAETSAVWRAIGFPVPHAHQGILDLALQIGVVGVVIFLVAWTTTLLAGWRLVKLSPEASCWIVSVMVAQAFMSLSENLFLDGWFSILILIRTVAMRKDGFDLQYVPFTGDRFAEDRAEVSGVS